MGSGGSLTNFRGEVKTAKKRKEIKKQLLRSGKNRKGAKKRKVNIIVLCGPLRLCGFKSEPTITLFPTDDHPA
jgi:hypothetical protein